MIEPKPGQRNLTAFLWHAAFLALASNFMDVDTIISSMLIKSGGTSLHLGFLTAIMLGGSGVMQLAFAGFLSSRRRKKPHLLIGINLRVAALLSLAGLFTASVAMAPGQVIVLIFVFITLFSFSGSYANLSYMDILGKSIGTLQRKRFFSVRQVINSIGFMISAFLAKDFLQRFAYPLNYSVLFLAAAMLLLAASAGFWRIEEPVSMIKKNEPRQSLFTFLKQLPAELRASNNLKYYLLIINSLGLGVSILPFLILLARDRFGLSYNMIGNFLVLRTIGMLSVGLLLYGLSRRFQYRNLLQFTVAVAALLPVSALIAGTWETVYPFVFVLSGVFMAVYKVALNGVLLEISTDQNRTTYTGISGAGNILTMLFPLIAGYIISVLGYTLVFVTISLLILSSMWFVLQLNCKPVTEK